MRIQESIFLCTWVFYKARPASGHSYYCHTGSNMSQKRKESSYPLSMKVGVLQRLDNGERASKLSNELGIPPGTISLWKQPSTRAQILA